METSSIACASCNFSSAQTADAVKTEVLRKSMALDKQHAEQLLQGIPRADPRSNPPSIGQNVNEYV